MRILFVTDRYPPQITGGYEIACASIAEGLQRRGHLAHVLTSDFGLNGSRSREPGVDRSLHYKQNATGMLDLTRWELADLRALRRLFAMWKPDLISVWSMWHLFPSLHHVIREAGVPVVYNIHDTWLPRHLNEAEALRDLWNRPGTTWPKRFGKALARKALKAVHSDWLRPIAVSDVALAHTVFCSHYQQAKYLESGLPEGDTRVIYNGIDTARFDGDPDRVQPGALRLLFVGRLVAEKGAHTAVAAVEELHRRGHHGVSLSIAGVPAHPWDYAEGLKSKCQSRELAGSVRWLGTVPHASLPDVYSSHDVLVFPSSHLEGLPMTLLEAMACGLAVVGSASGGNVELLEDGVNSLVVPPGDASGLADALQRLIANPEVVRSLAARGQRLVREKFAIETAVSLSEEYYQQVVERHGHT